MCVWGGGGGGGDLGWGRKSKGVRTPVHKMHVITVFLLYK